MGPFTYARLLTRWFQGHPRSVALILVCLIVEVGFEAYIPIAFEHIIDGAIIPRNMAVFTHTMTILAVGLVIATGAGLLIDFSYSKLATEVVAGIRVRLFTHLQGLSASFFHKHSAGDITARYSTDLSAVEHTLDTWMHSGWKPLLELGAYNIVLFIIDWRLALVAQLFWPMALLGPRFFAPKATAAATDMKAGESGLLSAVDEATAGRHVVRAFGLERTMTERFAGKVRGLTMVARRGALFSSLLDRSSGTGIIIVEFLIIGAGTYMVLHDQLTVGQLVAFDTVASCFALAMLRLAQYFTELIHCAPGFERIEEIFAQQTAVPETANATELPPITRAIKLNEFVFMPEPDRRILDGVSLTIRHGESVAFVGPSGSGKSTVLNAIMRTFDPAAGSVTIDDHDLRSVTKASFIKQSAVVFQESFLYNTTVRENLRLGREGATDADIEIACRDAEIHDIIMAMPKGYDSPVGERGALLSGGQRQRLAIARALLRNPRILFLDEATSALDPGTEIAINETLERLSKGRTVMAVTHRLASVTKLDRIFVMNKGRLAESGTHGELLFLGGIYAGLWKKQEGIHTNDDGTHADISVARLKQFTILSKLSDELLRELSVSQFVTEKVPAGRDVVIEGDHGDKFYIIARGRVDVLKRQSDGSSQRLTVLEDGDNFGELALLRDIPRNATIRTIDPCIFLTLQRDHFQHLLDSSPEMRAAILDQEASRTSAPFANFSVAPFMHRPAPRPTG